LAGENNIQHWQGEIVRIAKYVDPTTQAISVFIKLNPNKDKPLFNGQYLKATFTGMVIDNAFSIPRNAVYNYNEVYVVFEGKLQKRIITVEKINKNDLIISGLKEGINVVVEPLINVVENTEVKILQ